MFTIKKKKFGFIVFNFIFSSQSLHLLHNSGQNKIILVYCDLSH